MGKSEVLLFPLGSQKIRKGKIRVEIHCQFFLKRKNNFSPGKIFPSSIIRKLLLVQNWTKMQNSQQIRPGLLKTTPKQRLTNAIYSGKYDRS